MSDKFIIKNGEVVEEPNLLKWAQWMETHREERILKQEDVNGYFVSTVFLGLDYGFGDKTPVLFETMVFKDGKDIGDYTERYHTPQEAMIGHSEKVGIISKLEPVKSTGKEL